MSDRLIERHARTLVGGALCDTRVVFVMGARQVGKSTLVTLVADRDHPAQVLTLDDQATCDAARADPDRIRHDDQLTGKAGQELRRDGDRYARPMGRDRRECPPLP